MEKFPTSMSQLTLFFMADLLEEVTLDLTVLMANFTAITEKYNEMNGENKMRETCRIHLP